MPFTPETKDPISTELLMKIDMTRSGEILEFSVREQTSVTSPMRIQEYPRDDIPDVVPRQILPMTQTVQKNIEIPQLQCIDEAIDDLVVQVHRCRSLRRQLRSHSCRPLRKSLTPERPR